MARSTVVVPDDDGSITTRRSERLTAAAVTGRHVTWEFDDRDSRFAVLGGGYDAS
jgi:hypothetical protein